VQRLAKFEADDAGAEHGDRRRQILPVEDVVVDDQPIAGSAQHRRQVGRGAGGDHRAAELDGEGDAAVRPGHLERVRSGETRVADEPVARRDLVDTVEHETDEAVALATHAGHHGAAIDAHRAIEPQPERGPTRDAVRSLGGSDEQLARHAADAGARGAKRPALDDDSALAGSHCGSVGSEAGSAGADHGDIDFDMLHGGLQAQAALSRRPAQASSASEPPMYWPLMNTCGTVPWPVMARTTWLRLVLPSSISL